MDQQSSGQPAGAGERQIVIAIVRCDDCAREYASVAAVRLGYELPPCGECGGNQRVVDLVVAE
jgi:hypothetical protein